MDSTGLNERDVLVTLELLRSTLIPDTAVQVRVQEEIRSLKTRVESFKYLTWIFAEHKGDTHARQVAGLLVGSMYDSKIQPEVAAYVKHGILKALSDDEKIIRDTAGTTIATIIRLEGSKHWPEALEALADLIRNNRSPIVSESAMSAFSKIADDELELAWPATELELFINISRTQFIPLLLRYTAPNVEVDPRNQLQAMKILGIYNRRQVFSAGEFGESFFPEFWDACSRMALQSQPEMKLVVLEAIIEILEYQTDTIIANAPGIFRFFSESARHPNRDVKRVSLGFWPAISTRSEAIPFLAEIAPDLVPVLVEATVYGPDDLEALNRDHLVSDNAAEPDEEQNLQPRYYRDDGDDDDRVRSTWGDTWTVRKAAAYALDTLSVALGPRILPHALPLIEKKLGNPESWEDRESGVLSLGAISKGCLKALENSIPAVLSVLIGLSKDPHPLLRSICCWCINRFSTWICSNESPYLEQVVVALLERMLDRNKCVQEAACSALACLEEHAGGRLTPYLPAIFTCFIEAFGLYQQRNMTNLYDAIATLAASLGEPFVTQVPELSQRVMSFVVGRWERLSHTDREASLLCECLSNIMLTLRHDYTGHSVSEEWVVKLAPINFSKATALIRGVIGDMQRSRLDSTYPNQHNTEVIEGSIYLLSHTIDALGRQAGVLITMHRIDEVLELLVDTPACTKVDRLRQAAFALYGDTLAHSECMRRIEAKIIPLMIDDLRHMVWAVAANACWAIRQTADTQPEGLVNYLPAILSELAKLLTGDLITKGLREMAAITLGRLANCFPEAVSELLNTRGLLSSWCRVLQNAKCSPDSIGSIAGMAKAWNLNPSAVREAKDDVSSLLQNVALFNVNNTDALCVLEQVHKAMAAAIAV